MPRGPRTSSESEKGAGGVEQCNLRIHAHAYAHMRPADKKTLIVHGSVCVCMRDHGTRIGVHGRIPRPFVGVEARVKRLQNRCVTQPFSTFLFALENPTELERLVRPDRKTTDFERNGRRTTSRIRLAASFRMQALYRTQGCLGAMLDT